MIRDVTGGFDEVILFHGWRISSMTGLVVAWCLVFALAIAYEGIKFVRERIDAHCPCVGKEPCCQSNGVNAGTTSSAVLANANSESGTSPIRLIVPSTQGERFRRAMRMPSHWLQAGLNMLQIFVAYLLMSVGSGKVAFALFNLNSQQQANLHDIQFLALLVDNSRLGRRLSVFRLAASISR